MRISRALLSMFICMVVGQGSTNATNRPQEVDVLLVLALDVSESLTKERFEIQKKGYAAAFRDPEILSIIQSGLIGSIAVTAMEWSDVLDQEQVIGWTLINDEASAHNFANLISLVPRLFNSGTNIAGAIRYCAELLENSPFVARKHVCDISGDGKHRVSEFPYAAKGVPIEQARAEVVSKGIIINGLPIIGDEFEIDKYYEQEVIGGEGSFSITIKNPDDIEAVIEAIKKKLFLEIVSS